MCFCPCSLDRTCVTLFWAVFALVALVTLEVNLHLVEVFGKLLFGLYNVAAKIMLVNMLIAMMSKSFHHIVVSRLGVEHAQRRLLIVSVEHVQRRLLTVSATGFWGAGVLFG